MTTLSNLFSSLIHVNVVRYLTISGVSVLAYDTLITFEDEVQYVWAPLIQYTSELLFRHERYTQCRMASILQKLLIIFVRYTMLVIASIFLFVLLSTESQTNLCCKAIMPLGSVSTAWLAQARGTLFKSTESIFRCQSVYSAIMSFDVFIELMGSAVVLYRLFLLWDLDRRTIQIITGGLIIIHLVSLFSAFAAIARARGRDPEDYSNCINNSESQRLFGILYNDGLFFFLLIANLQADLFFIAIIFSGTMVTTVTCQSLLSLVRRNDNKDDPYNDYEDDGLKADNQWKQDTKMMVLNVLLQYQYPLVTICEIRMLSTSITRKEGGESKQRGLSMTERLVNWKGKENDNQWCTSFAMITRIMLRIRVPSNTIG
ncbi:uncharacterized protein FOMMEDRAFT_27006 [Fomitiporia mediterranea MF3/22]|uniref:uncharacterized protein n=1 Tax=Fomitiporia mediterranea (strain MF3/22) TaxID=694068 RepID=UPI00044077A0|nr:uncharacterized protein FOMMEDRAFT_27006 [Fomitiporia mediterranea MF3/22]EJD04662.1 hypothetical protein FOMMEDRAFT_27006 [Fomitiporia mediterranea MF3/22]